MGAGGKVKRRRKIKNKEICPEIFFALLLICRGQIFLRGDGIETEGIPGMHPIPAAEREDAGPGGAGEDHPRCAARLSGTLQQLWGPVPEPWPLCGEVHRLLL